MKNTEHWPRIEAGFMLFEMEVRFPLAHSNLCNSVLAFSTETLKYCHPGQLTQQALMMKPETNEQSVNRSESATVLTFLSETKRRTEQWLLDDMSMICRHRHTAQHGGDWKRVSHKLIQERFAELQLCAESSIMDTKVNMTLSLPSRR